MVHPAAFALSVGFGLGAVLFLIYSIASRDGPQRAAPEREYRPTWRDPLDNLRQQYDSDVCSVCLDQLGEHPSSLECRHRFHRECIERSLLHSPLCPMCRAHAKVAL